MILGHTIFYGRREAEQKAGGDAHAHLSPIVS